VAGLALLGILVVALLQGLAGPGGTSDLVRPATVAAPELWDGRSLGPAEAPLELVVWSDFQCPACRLFAQTVEPILLQRYVVPGKLRITYRDYAFLGDGTAADESIGAAVGARCAARQEAFWPYHDSLFANQRGENQGAFRQPTLIDIAGLVGLDQGQFSTCLADPAVRAAVIEETGQGRGVPVKATPTLIVAGQVIEGVPSIAALTALLDAELAGS
jgi:protein-disulfide isomerase